MKYDVTVVGAGPAGSTTAKFLSEKGLKVVLMDKDKFPRDKTCGGGIPKRVLERYEYVDNENIIESYSYSGVSFSPSLKNKIEIEKKTPLIATALRKKFDYGLVKLAKENGTIIKDGEKIIDIKITKDSARVVLANGKNIDSEIIVGADGVWSVVAKSSGLRDKDFKTGMCVLQEFKVNKKTMDKFFGKQRKCYIHSRFKEIRGYGWVFPKKEHLNIGLGGVWVTQGKKTNLSKIFMGYVDFLKDNNIIPKNIKVSSIKGGALPIFPLKKTYSERILLVGDAAGFINPSTGEGIYYAMASGEIAASVILESLEKNDFSSDFLSTYQKRWEKDFGKDLKLYNKLITKETSEDLEKVFRTIGNDKKLSELFLGALTGEISIKENKNKIMARYIYCAFRNKLKKIRQR